MFHRRRSLLLAAVLLLLLCSGHGNAAPVPPSSAPNRGRPPVPHFAATRPMSFLNPRPGNVVIGPGSEPAAGPSREIGGPGRSFGGPGRSFGGLGRSFGGPGRSFGGPGRGNLGNPESPRLGAGPGGSSRERGGSPGPGRARWGHVVLVDVAAGTAKVRNGLRIPDRVAARLRDAARGQGGPSRPSPGQGGPPPGGPGRGAGGPPDRPMDDDFRQFMNRPA